MKHTEIIRIGNGLEIHYFLDENETNRQLTLFKCVVHPGAKVPVPHYHENFDETVFGLKGVGNFTVDGKTIELKVGDAVFISRGTVHGFVNRTDETIEFLCFASPGVFGPDYFKDIAGIINAGGPPDMTKMKEIMLNYGLVPVAG